MPIHILLQAAVENNTWIVTVLTGETNEDNKKNPYDTAILISPDGKIVLNDMHSSNFSHEKVSLSKMLNLIY
ncbi:hypothetical protein [Metallosphaera sp.]|uniref:hypothetical protein n=1 Tax=Metallosphaera sp. TaxID=2020860 RepID=UPI00319DC69B